MKPFRVNLSVAILTSLAALLLLSWLLLSIISFTTARKDLVAQKNEQARILLATFVSALPPRLQLPADPAPTPAGRISATIGRERDFLDLLVTDANGAPVYYKSAKGSNRPLNEVEMRETVRSGKKSFVVADNGQAVVRYAPIVESGEVVGAARLSLAFGSEFERLEHSRRIFFAYFVLDFLLLFGLGSFMLRRIVVLPVSRLLAATERITAGDYSHPVHGAGSKEIGDLADAFNLMVHSLKVNKDEVEQHVASLEEANRALQVAREETIRSEKLASVGVLAAGMAHEIGTPLSAIIGYAGMLKDDLADEPDKADHADRIEREAHRIDRLVRELLDYARPRRPECERFAIGPFLAETVAMLDRQGLFKRVKVSLSVAEGIPEPFIDRHQLLQVLINLLVNARDAMPEGGTISVSAVHTLNAPGMNRAVTITVRDSGEGIAPEHLDKVFDPFFTTKDPGRGTGLGLAICARIMDGFGGKITVRSRRGEGTEFVIWLPVAEPDYEGEPGGK